MKTFTKTLFALILTLTITTFGGCATPGPAEKTGEKIDDAVDNVKEGQSPFRKKGAAEKVGEAIDDATK